jgi:large subunit ribosomal protein L18
MKKAKEKRNKKIRRHFKVRYKISGTDKKPRVSVFKSNKGMYIQLINDLNSQTILSVNSKEIKKSKDKKVDIAFKAGKLLAEKALKKKIKEVVFDRGPYRYHGRIKAVADGAREGGLIL